MKNTKVAAVLAACALFMGGCSASPKASVMTIGDNKISGNAVSFYVAELLNAGSSFDSVKEKAAEYIEDAYLAKTIADAMGIELSEDDQDDINSTLIKIRQRAGGKKTFDSMLKEYGLSDDFMKVLLGQQYYEEEIKDELSITDPTEDELKEYFKENYLRAKHVLVMVDDSATDEEKETAKEKAESVLEQANAGANFDDLITQYNEDPGMSSNPDGYIFTDGDMVQEFEDETKALGVGEFGLCQTSYGYHVIQRLAIDETDELFAQFFEDNESAVETAATEKKEKDAILAKADELGIKINVNDDAISSLKAPEVKTTEAPSSSN